MVVKNKLPGYLSLKSKVEINRLFEKGQRLSGDYFTLLWEKSDNFKYGIFVRKEHGSAVYRNRIKRLYREAVRLNRMLLENNVKIAILPKKIDQAVRFNEINAEISKLFKTIGTGTNTA